MWCEGLSYSSSLPGSIRSSSSLTQSHLSSCATRVTFLFASTPTRHCPGKRLRPMRACAVARRDRGVPRPSPKADTRLSSQCLPAHEPHLRCSCSLPPRPTRVPVAAAWDPSASRWQVWFFWRRRVLFPLPVAWVSELGNTSTPSTPPGGACTPLGVLLGRACDDGGVGGGRCLPAPELGIAFLKVWEATLRDSLTPHH